MNVYIEHVGICEHHRLPRSKSKSLQKTDQVKIRLSFTLFVLLFDVGILNVRRYQDRFEKKIIQLVQVFLKNQTKPRMCFCEECTAFLLLSSLCTTLVLCLFESSFHFLSLRPVSLSVVSDESIKWSEYGTVINKSKTYSLIPLKLDEN